MLVRNALVLHRCEGCDDVRAFEVPPCGDGHDPADCPELACTDCGEAVVLGHLAGTGVASSTEAAPRVPEEDLLFARSPEQEPDLAGSRPARASWSLARSA